MKRSYIFKEGDAVVFTTEEIAALKAIAQEHIFFENVYTKDKDGKPYPYRNRYSIDVPHLAPEKEKEKC